MTKTNRPSHSYASRWPSLLVENSILHQEHDELVASFVRPFSSQQIAQLKASAARLGTLPAKVQQLVEDWAKSQISRAGIVFGVPSAEVRLKARFGHDLWCEPKKAALCARPSTLTR